LPNGNTFIASFNELTEVDPKGAPLWSYKNPEGSTIYRARRLPNGHLLFACANNAVVELDAAGKEVRRIKIPAATAGWGDVELLPGNHYLVAAYSGGKVFELDASGKVLWECATQSPTSAMRLPNGNTLVACNDIQTIAEYDRAGKEVWKMKVGGNAFCVRRY